MPEVSERGGREPRFKPRIWGDMHVHSSFSVDAEPSVAQVCRRASELGMSFIYITDHFDHNPLDRGAGRLDPILYRDELVRQRELWRGKVELRIGIEVSEPHVYRDEFRRLLEIVPLDVVIGAVHWLPGVPVYPEDEEFFRSTPPEKAYTAYFREVLRMMEFGGFDVLAHIDFIKRKAVRFYGPFNWEEYRGLVVPVLEAAVERGIALEVNTSGLRRPCGETCPTSGMLREYRRLGGRMVTVGSDAHRTDDIGSGFHEALREIRAAGFDEITFFRGRTPYQVRIDCRLGI